MKLFAFVGFFVAFILAAFAFLALVPVMIGSLFIPSFNNHTTPKSW